MKTEKELSGDILEITMTIEKKYPELSKYLEETPFEISGAVTSEVNTKNLKDYYDSLDALLKNYVLNHESKIQ
jgi:hypothetical protein